MCGTLRSVTAARTAPTAEIPAATSSAWWKPCTNATACGFPAFDELAIPAATIAPMIAIPSEPPTWRMLFSTAEPTPALSGLTELIAAAVTGAIAADIPTPPSSIPGKSPQKLACVPELREDEHRAGENHHPGRDQRARADLVGEAPGLRCEQDDQHRPGQEGRACLGRRVAEHLLEVQRDVEEDAEHREPDEQHHGVRAREDAVPEEREVEHRQPLVQLEQDEPAERDRRDRKGSEDPARRPAVGVRLDQRVAEREEAERGGGEARDVRTLLAARCRATRR